jgi:hypothetical protein
MKLQCQVGAAGLKYILLPAIDLLKQSLQQNNLNFEI